MRALPAAGVLLLLAGAAHAQASGSPDDHTVKVTGQVRHPIAYTLDDLRALPNVTVQWTTGTGQATRTAFYEGPLLWDILKAADPIDAPGEGAAGRSHLQHVVLARGADGYAAAFAIGEVDPEFEGKKILLALPRTGQPTLQIAVPNDVRGGRGVHDLVELEVR